MFERVRSWFGLKTTHSPELQRMREALEAGRRAKFAEEYDRALGMFGRAMESAQATRDAAAISVVGLHEAEALARIGRWDDAEPLLTSLEHTARLVHDDVQLGYILCARGALRQDQGDWAGARAFYEQALDAARGARAAGPEGRALGHLGDTYLHEGNASYALHLLRDALPKLNTSGDIELSSLFVGLLGQAMIVTGQEVEGQHLLSRALQLAEQIHYRMYERRWSLVLGDRAAAEARFPDARAHYARALKLFAPDAIGEEYISALCRMSQVCLSLRDHAEALTHAERAVTRAERISEELAARAWGTMGSALRAVGRSAEAIPFLSAAAAVYQQRGDQPADALEIETLRSLAGAMVDADDPGAPATYTLAIDKAQAAGRPLEVAQCRRDRGLMHARRGAWADALQDWMAALGGYETDKYHAQVARLYTDMASARRALGQGQRALKDYEHALMALNAVDEHDSDTRGVVLANAATVYAEQGDVESADSFFTDAIAMAEKVGDVGAESTRRGNYGLFLLMIGRPRRGLAMLEQALHLSRSHHLTLQTAVQTSNVGLAHDAMGSYREAATYHRQAVELARALRVPRWLAYTAANLANSLLALGDRDEASQLVAQSLVAACDSGDADVLILALTAQAHLETARGEFDAAARAVGEAITLARRSDHRRLLAEALYAQSELAAAEGRGDDAARAWDEAHKLYEVLRMPEAKRQPAWLDRPSPAR